MNRYFVEIHEDGCRILVGKKQGYETFGEAKEVALAKVDDALPYNTVHVLKDIGHAYLRLDGEPEFQSRTNGNV